MITELLLPEVEITETNVSRWNAAFNPVVLNFTSELPFPGLNYTILIEITAEVGFNTLAYFSPSPSGKCRCDISAYLKSWINAKDSFQYDVVNYTDLNRSHSFTLRYMEIWDGGSNPWETIATPIHAVYSAKQLGDKFGGNMAEYVPFLNQSSPTVKAKFLTKFEEPTAWIDLPFDLSYIYSEYLTTGVKVRTTSLDINKQPFGGKVYSYILSNDSGDNVLVSAFGRMISGESSLEAVSNQSITGGVGINRLMIAGSPGIGVEYLQIQMYTGTDSAPNFVTESLIVKIETQCKDPYVYLKWINTLGGWDYWRFGYDQLLQISTSNDTTIDRYVLDWENDETIADVIKKSGINKITVGATVPKSKVEGLKGLFNSIKVQMLVSTDPYKWQTVIIPATSIDLKRVKQEFTDIKLTISLPEVNIQSQ